MKPRACPKCAVDLTWELSAQVDCCNRCGYRFRYCPDCEGNISNAIRRGDATCPQCGLDLVTMAHTGLTPEELTALAQRAANTPPRSMMEKTIETSAVIFVYACGAILVLLGILFAACSG